ncbi:hypothetical protein BU16DRAFT_521480 [Lophium mytilinum]|uniref:Uncharacterized protein n=1 Tax=Lophium mytilinum TaxID=390894 RepID=A0A6A6RH82_9PEZI|nr:hypothetical protein BU16DRAFT_521480 [Lophium mytilinum]
MAAPSPSEFLTFYRRIALSPTLRRPLTTTRPLATRPFTLSTRLQIDSSAKTDKFPDDEHATSKKDRLDVQSDSAHSGKNSKATGEGGTATEQSDSQGATAKAKKEHPEAPDTVIGMQDERGGKGG